MCNRNFLSQSSRLIPTRFRKRTFAPIVPMFLRPINTISCKPDGAAGFCHKKTGTVVCPCLIPYSVLIELENSSDCKQRTVADIGNFNSVSTVTCVNNLSVSDVDSYVSAVANNISRLHIR